ncbi:glycosyltransferase family 4 protein [Sphingobacterium suaedae]|uniref:Glycosyltransferase family 4 protein n=1 Tax=Sphingobacterium suaedae TaxID=1686402 RepID=A0ABW5KGM5_9SPHI
MEILFVSHKYPPATGGMEKQSHELINGMLAHATVHKIVYTGEESYYRFFRRLNDRILKKIHSHPNISVVHFNDGLIASMSLWHTGYNHLTRIVTVHGLDVVFPSKIYQRFILPRFNRYDHIIAVSHATADAIIHRGVTAHKVSVIANGIDHHLSTLPTAENWDTIRQKYGLPIDKKILVALGRPVKRKGFSWFIREVLPLLPEDIFLVLAGPFEMAASKREKWLEKLPRRWRNLYMLFMGYPSDQPELRRLLFHPAFTNRTKHVGKLPLADLKVLLCHADAFVMPNIQVEGDMEGFGLVCLEAASCGTIVLAANLEGINDAILHGKNGIQVQHHDAEAWRKTVVETLTDKSHAECRNVFRAFTLQHFSWEKMVRDYAVLFRKLSGNAD